MEKPLDKALARLVRLDLLGHVHKSEVAGYYWQIISRGFRYPDPFDANHPKALLSDEVPGIGSLAVKYEPAFSRAKS